ncbi:TIGR00255 family protein [Lachnospiraceae bacterium A10]|jgi:uncharacterized protein (TIGR00255 family)|nr:TIGR00255 family protein [Lachnospiraceae bacterium A10]
MVKSMTGFGRFEDVQNDYRVVVEIKSVNHRYLDLNVKMGSKIGFLENQVRSVIKDRIIRGKVDVYIGYEESADASVSIVYNKEVARMYLENLRKIAEDFDVEDDIKVSSLSKYPDVLEVKEDPSDVDQIWSRVEAPLNQALDAFVESRRIEGERLQKDLLEKLDQMSTYVDVIEKRSPELIVEYKKNLISKVHDLLEDHYIDDNRIAAEVTVYADKICVDEELVRLHSHIDEVRKLLTTKEEVGRKLDFLAQELNRESNTILSKSTDVQIADLGIELKTLIEKIREQIQNLE